jgi:hypothetical protein
MLYHIRHSTVSQVKFVNDAVDCAPRGSPLYKLPHIRDPTDEIVAAHLAALSGMFCNLISSSEVLPFQCSI